MRDEYTHGIEVRMLKVGTWVVTKDGHVCFIDQNQGSIIRLKVITYNAPKMRALPPHYLYIPEDQKVFVSQAALTVKKKSNRKLLLL